MRIENNILNIIENCTVTGNTVFLPPQQLDRDIYLKVNKCLESIGGKWNKKAKGHVFEEDPTQLLDTLILTGETTDLKKELQFFETPEAVVDDLIFMAEIERYQTVLEPSAGKGAIASRIPALNLKITCIELHDKHTEILKTKSAGWNIIQGNFLEHTGKYDRIIANPPFSKQQDVDHITHMYSLLNEKGILVSIVSESPFFRCNRKSEAFRNFLAETHAEIYPLEEGTFKSSGTMVKTRIIKIKK